MSIVSEPSFNKYILKYDDILTQISELNYQYFRNSCEDLFRIVFLKKYSIDKRTIIPCIIEIVSNKYNCLISRKKIADLFGISPNFLSRELKRLSFFLNRTNCVDGFLMDLSYL